LAGSWAIRHQLNYVVEVYGQKMATTDELSIYDEIEIEDMSFDDTMGLYTFPCPCGDRFEILLEDLRDGEDVAVCPSCSLMIRVIFWSGGFTGH